MGQKVLVIGAARSGLSSAEFLAKAGNQVVLTDMKQCQDVENLKSLGVSLQWSISGVPSQNTANSASSSIFAR